MKVGTSLRFLFPAGPQTLAMYQAITAALPPGAFTDRPMGDDDVGSRRENLVEIARAAQAANMWGLLVGDNHAIPPQYANMFQPVPTIARLSAETGPMMLGMVLLAPFYHPLLLAEQVGTLSAFVDAPLVITFACGGSAHAFDRFGYRIGSRGPRFEEMIPVVRALLAGEARHRRRPVVRGRRGDDLAAAAAADVEIWIAGTNDITVERAGRLGDGWLTAQNATDEHARRAARAVPAHRRRDTAGRVGRCCAATSTSPRPTPRHGPTSNRSSSRAIAGRTRPPVGRLARHGRGPGCARTSRWGSSTSWSATSPATTRR